MRPAAALVLIAALAAGTATAEARPRGACHTVYARLTVGNGTPAWRLWPVGTGRLLGVHTAAGEPELNPRTFPGRLGQAFRDPRTLQAAEQRRLFGDFTVCPLAARRPGVMQPVCIQSARRLVVRPR